MMKKRLCSFMLALVLLFCMLPLAALAEGTTPVIVIGGYSSPQIYLFDDEGNIQEKVWGLSLNKALDVVKNDIPNLTKANFNALLKRDPTYIGDKISDAVLQIAVGHIEGTSLPTGGAGTHTVLSGHRGLPSARLFTDLDQMEEDALFVIRVMDRVMTYMVDQILIVLPEEMDGLAIDPGEDYCTLVTCTPYGINSHRLLGRGRRTDNVEMEQMIKVVSDATQVKPILVAPVLAAPMLLILLIWMMISTGRKQQRRKIIK